MERVPRSSFGLRWLRRHLNYANVIATLALVFAITGPMRQAFMNGLIPSEQRATVLSFDSLMGSAGGVVIQPGLGRAADVYSYGASFVIAAAVEALAIPFGILARREHASSDPISDEAGPERLVPEPDLAVPGIGDPGISDPTHSR